MQLTIGKTLLYERTARPLNDPYESNELNLPLADRYSAGVLDMGEIFSLETRKHTSSYRKTCTLIS